jgi:ubiquinone/menaquinone biosynthesis C-methylase UbiE
MRSDISHCRNPLHANNLPTGPSANSLRTTVGGRQVDGREVMTSVTNKAAHPGAGLRTEKMPGHWVLARLGKRVLRPGGMQLTRRMLEALQIKSGDDVVEFAPGMGVTARLTIELHPASYTAVERDKAAAKIVSGYLKGERQRCVVGSASDTGLPEQSATVVYGEAMLTMQTEEMKRDIVREAYRLLKSGGRYGIHEMCLLSDKLDENTRKETERALTGVVHHGVRPLTVSEWRSLLESEGFEVQSAAIAAMSLLEPRRLISDEGLAGALRFAWNVLRDSEARRRVFEMRSVFRRYRKVLAAVALVARRS